MMDKLEKARMTINEVDAEMARLFCRRMEVVNQVALYKKEHGLPILDSEREAAVIAAGAARVDDPTVREYYVRYIGDVMEISRAYQARLLEGMKVAYCGTEGAFAYFAAKKKFPSAALTAYRDFESAYRSVENGECDAVVLPVDNSTTGCVGQVTDLLFSGSLYVNSALDLSIDQDLVGLPTAKLEDITDVISHPQALGQCEKYIGDHGFTVHEYANTALAAKYVAEKGDPTLAAIASGETAALFGLRILDRSINEGRMNTTRFLVLSRSAAPAALEERGMRSILIFTVRNEAGALAKAIDVIGGYGYNMLTLRSRPMKELLWQFYFYIELEGNYLTENGKKMTTELAKYCDRCKLVGTYKQGEVRT